MARIKNNFLTQDEKAFHIRQAIDGTQRLINLAMKHYDETKDLEALKIAFDGNVTLRKMLRQVQELYSFGHDFELTR